MIKYLGIHQEGKKKKNRNVLGEKIYFRYRACLLISAVNVILQQREGERDRQRERKGSGQIHIHRSLSVYIYIYIYKLYNIYNIYM